MGAGSWARGVGVVLLALGIGGCGGGGGKSDEEQAREDAEAVVRTLADNAGDPVVACRTLTLASRRVVSRLSGGGGGCTKGFSRFADDHELQPALGAAQDITAAVRGGRAQVTVVGLGQPLTAVGGAGVPWRVSLIDRRVRSDLAAADACSRYLDAADGLGVPPATRSGTARFLAGQARLVGGLRQRLEDLPEYGRTRNGIGLVTDDLQQSRRVLLRAARTLRGSGDDVSLEYAAQLGPRVDGLLRARLRETAPDAGVVCPRDVTATASAGPRARRLDRACDVVVRFNRDQREPDTLAELEAIVARYRRLLAATGDTLRGVDTPAALRGVQRQGQRALEALRADAEVLASEAILSKGPSFFERVEGHAGQVDAALVRLGATCLDPQARPDVAPEGRFTQN